MVCFFWWKGKSTCCRRLPQGAACECRLGRKLRLRPWLLREWLERWLLSPLFLRRWV